MRAPKNGKQKDRGTAHKEKGRAKQGIEDPQTEEDGAPDVSKWMENLVLQRVVLNFVS